MSLTGTPFFFLTIALVVLAVAAMVAIWNRIPGPTPARVAARVGLTVFSQVAAVLMVLVYVNNSMGPFYDTWGSLFGQNADVQVTATGSKNAGSGDGSPSATGVSAQKLNFTKYNDDVLQANAVGPESHIKGDMYVWLPPQYNDPAFAHTNFPVAELLPGTPGSPKTWFGSMHADKAMIKLMGEGKVKPMILVSAKLNMFGGSKDSGCVNLPGGFQTATWLAKDVPTLMRQNFRVADDPKKWAILGYSAGGYCAANLTVQYPQSFSAGVSMSGYNAPDAAVVVKDPKLAAANNPLLLLQKARPQPDIQLLMEGTLQDGSTVADAKAMLRALHNPRNSQLLTLSKGDHTTETFITEMTPSLIWASQQIAG
ncbi:enterochelin esterase-like enzyme [Streptacidiphilus sp. MAP12-16]|uniref:alpha/beta hydrolase n=1 Tax=Streptacidiphilus sp. MAP12-16 TaxID=3156300 RepID=UPI0035151931